MNRFVKASALIAFGFRNICKCDFDGDEGGGNDVYYTNAYHLPDKSINSSYPSNGIANDLIKSHDIHDKIQKNNQHFAHITFTKIIDILNVFLPYISTTKYKKTFIIFQILQIAFILNRSS